MFCRTASWFAPVAFARVLLESRLVKTSLLKITKQRTAVADGHAVPWLTVPVWTVAQVAAKGARTVVCGGAVAVLFSVVLLSLVLNLLVQVLGPVPVAAEDVQAGDVQAKDAQAEDFRAEPMKLESGQLMIAPRPDSVVVVSKVWLILKSDDPNAEPGEVKFNGEPVSWNPRFVGNVRVTDLWLDIGWQKMEVNGQKFRFAMGQNDIDHVGPKEWPVVRLHNMKPGPNPCAECHQCEKEDRKIRVGELKPPQDACFHCHEVPKLTEQHEKVKLEENWQESCRDCHYLHVSPYPYLLRKPKEGYMK